MTSPSSRAPWIALFLSCCALALWGYAQYREYIWQPIEIDSARLRIAPGDSLERIATSLQRQGVIRSATAFRLYARWRGVQGSIQAGEYRFSGRIHAADVLDRLLRGDVEHYRVTIAEGLRTETLLRRLAEQTELPLERWRQAARAVLGDQAWEGYLLPETYDYTRPVEPLRILRRMRKAQQKVIDDLLASGVEHSAREIRIIASIIEKETAREQEKALVSAVIHNRLRKNMPLQMDPTVLYGRWKLHPQAKGRLHRRDLQEDSPWNTYTRTGLPATPICNPGRASLYAAAHPADVDYLYFVANGKGGHNFASTLRRHQENVRHWLRHQPE